MGIVDVVLVCWDGAAEGGDGGLGGTGGNAHCHVWCPWRCCLVSLRAHRA